MLGSIRDYSVTQVTEGFEISFRQIVIRHVFTLWTACFYFVGLHLYLLQVPKKVASECLTFMFVSRDCVYETYDVGITDTYTWQECVDDATGAVNDPS